MTRADEADCLALLAQRCSIKDAAAMVGVSEWDVASLFRPCRKPRPAEAPAQRPLEPAEA